MLTALILSTLMLTGLYFSPKVRTLAKNKSLQSLYHIVTILLIIFGPIIVLPIFGVPVYVATLAGRFTVILGIPLLIFVAIKKLRTRNQARKELASS